MRGRGGGRGVGGGAVEDIWDGDLPTSGGGNHRGLNDAALLDGVGEGVIAVFHAGVLPANTASQHHSECGSQ